MSKNVIPVLLVFFFVFLFATHASTDQTLTPSGPATDIVIEHTHYTLGYDEQTEQAEWVMYEFTPTEAQIKACERTDDFRPDPKIATGSAELSDYKGSGYDRGHLAPAGDMNHDCTAMSESFYLSNMSPQDPAFNRGIWKNLESLFRTWAQGETLLIVTGPVLRGNTFIGPNQVLVPPAYYKIAYSPARGEAIAFLLPNRKGEGTLSNWIVTVNDIELITGIDFFQSMDNVQEESLEGSVNKSEWLKIDSAPKPRITRTTQTRSTPPNRTPTPQPSGGSVVKMSKSGICHDQSSRYYGRTKNYTPYKSIKDCLAAGGRRPKK